MTVAIDTDFLVAAEIRDHLFHKPADALLNRLLEDGHKFGRCAANIGGIRSCGDGFEADERAPVDGGGLGQSRALVASPGMNFNHGWLGWARIFSDGAGQCLGRPSCASESDSLASELADSTVSDSLHSLRECPCFGGGVAEN